MVINVLPALTDSGDLNAGIPLLMASTPVKAVQPAEKARNIRKSDRACSGPEPICSDSNGMTGERVPFIIL